MNKPHYTGHRSRLKERFVKTGLAGWQEHEVLELLLGYCLPRKDTKPIAKNLLDKFKSLHGVLNARPAKLREIYGIKDHSALFLNLAREVACHYYHNTLGTLNIRAMMVARIQIPPPKRLS